MAPTPQVVDALPLFLTGNTNLHSAKDFRKQIGEVIGQGVADYDSFRVRQRAAGANMSVDIQTASVLNRAYIRDSNVTDGGVYRVQFNNATVTNLDVATADPTNPRIDSVYLCVEDSEDTGSNNRATARMVTGTATGGATLDNRTGIGSAPASMSSILLADILVAAADTSITNAEIRDRRPWGCFGSVPAPSTGLQQVSFQPHANLGIYVGMNIQNTANFDNQASAALMWLPQRIPAATRVRYKYQQGGTANTAQHVIAIYDASGRLIVNPTAAAYTGTATQVVAVSSTITATTFEAGYYYVYIGNAAGTASAAIQASGVGFYTTSFAGPGSPNVFFHSSGSGVTVPTTILGMTDLHTLSGAAFAAHPAVPMITLSVG